MQLANECLCQWIACHRFLKVLINSTGSICLWCAVSYLYIFSQRYKIIVPPESEGVSKLSFQCGSRDAKFCVSTICLDKLLILNVFVLYVAANIETRHATSLLMAKSHFDTPSLDLVFLEDFMGLQDRIGVSYVPQEQRVPRH